MKVGDLVKHRYSDRMGIVIDIKDFPLRKEKDGKGIIVRFFDWETVQPYHYWISALKVISEGG